MVKKLTTRTRNCFVVGCGKKATQQAVVLGKRIVEASCCDDPPHLEQAKAEARTQASKQKYY